MDQSSYILKIFLLFFKKWIFDPSLKKKKNSGPVQDPNFNPSSGMYSSGSDYNNLYVSLRRYLVWMYIHAHLVNAVVYVIMYINVGAERVEG